MGATPCVLAVIASLACGPPLTQDVAAPATAPSAPSVVREDLDQFVATIVRAAENQDFTTLQSLMDDEFTISMVDGGGIDDALALWRRAPRLYLPKLTALLRGQCGFFETLDHWVCPLDLLGPDVEEFGDAERVHLFRRNGHWHWAGFIAESSETPTPTPSDGPPSAAPLIQTREPEADYSTTDPEQDPVRPVIREHLSEVRTCYRDALKRDPTLRGRMVLEFTIDSQGTVSKASAAENDFAGTTVGDCIIQRAQTWTFPPPKTGKRVHITYPFRFDPD